MTRFIRDSVCAFLASALCSGCGIHYYDTKTGVEHLWGFGHLQMRVPPATNGIEAIIKGYQVIGVKVGGSAEDYGVVVGYDDRRLILVNPTNSAFGIEWPTASFFNVRLTTNSPFLSPSLPYTPTPNTPNP